MLPIRDTIPSHTRPVVTWALILTNVAIFLRQAALPQPALEAFVFYFGMVPAALVNTGVEALPPSAGPLTFLSSMFLHGGFLHLIANMWTLWIFGDNVEDRMGHSRFLVFYILCGLLAGGAHLLSDPTSTVPTIGASGAIAGVLGAYFILFPRSRVLTLIPIFFYPLFVEIPAFVYLGFWFLSQVLSGSMTAGATGGGIAWWAHIGGFLAGVALFWFFLRRRPSRGAARHLLLADPPRSSWSRRRR
jgi:membrane associated rhomboid family serine protease